MRKSQSIHILASLLICAAIPFSAYGQTQDSFNIQNKAEISSLKADKPSRKIKREVEPIPYWVESSSLNVRDNPVAGRVVSTLDYGQTILAYDQYENWVKVSKPGSAEKWVNSDFLSNSKISWASYNRSPPTRSSDVISVRIKNPDNRKSRIYGVRLKSAQTGNALITTRENTAQGVFFQNRFVSCNDQRPVGMRLVGEGYSFLAAQNDVRVTGVDIYSDELTENKINGGVDRAISDFACKAQPF